MNEQQLQAFKSGQYDWVICLVLAIFAALLLLAWRSRVANKRAIERAKQLAGVIASQKWEVVQGAELWDRRLETEAFVLHIRSLNKKREEHIPFRPGHPDIRRLGLLSVGDHIQFERLAGDGKFALEHEVCAYLTLAKNLA